MWEQALSWIQDKLNDQVFEAWFSPVSLKEIGNDTLTLTVPNKFFKEWLSNNYIDLIEEAVFVQAGRRLVVKFVVSESSGVNLSMLPPRASTEPPERPPARNEVKLNPKGGFIVAGEGGGAEAPPTDVEGGFKSPMQGTVLSVKVAEGDKVNEGDIVATVEAMKMETEVKADHGGEIKKIYVEEGDAVETGTLMMQIL